MSLVCRLPNALRLAIFVLASAGTAAAQFSNSSASSSTSDDITTTITRRSTTTTYLTVTPTRSITKAPAVGNCSIDCQISAYYTAYQWQKQEINTTITAATKWLIVNNATNTTSTSLEFKDLPDGYTLPPMNEEGTQIWSISWTKFGGELATTTLTFPEEFNVDAPGYYWDGTYPTSTVGGDVCLTGKDSFRPYPSYDNANLAPLKTSRLGDNGLIWSSVIERYGTLPERERNPDDPILANCTTKALVAPIAALTTASFLTATSVKYENKAPQTSPTAVAPSPQPTSPEAVAPAPAPSPSAQEPTPEPAPSQPAQQPAPVPSAPAQQNPAPSPSPPAQGNTPAATPNNPAPAPVAPAPSQSGQTVVDGTTFVPIVAPIPTGGSPQASPVSPPAASTPQNAPANSPANVPANSPANSPANAPANTAGNTPAPNGVVPLPPSATVIGSQTFTPLAPVPTQGPAPIVIGGSTFTAVGSTTLAGPVAGTAGSGSSGAVGGGTNGEAGAIAPAVVPIYNVGGQSLVVGSTITIGTGSSAQTVGLQTDENGSTVFVQASGSSTQTKAVQGPAKITSTAGLGDYIGSGLGGTKPSTSSPAQVTTNGAMKLSSTSCLGGVWSMLMALLVFA